MISNQGKNETIVIFLDELLEEYIQHHKNVDKKILINAKERAAKIRQELFDNIIDEHFEEHDIDGTLYVQAIPIFDPDAERKDYDATKNLEDIETFNKNLEMRLTKLRNIIRIYLKLEWAEAKKGK